jgi:hypothetical protein
MTNQWVCKQCYINICNELHVDEIWICTIDNTWERNCEICNIEKAEHLINKMYYDIAISNKSNIL